MKTTTQMEKQDVSDKKNKLPTEQKEDPDPPSRGVFNARNVFSSLWLRRSIQNSNGGDWIVLDSRYYFLWSFRIFCVAFYLIYQIVK